MSNSAPYKLTYLTVGESDGRVVSYGRLAEMRQFERLPAIYLNQRLTLRLPLNRKDTDSLITSG